MHQSMRLRRHGVCRTQSRGSGRERTTGTARERRYKDSSADNSGGMKSIGLRYGQLCCCCSTARRGGGEEERGCRGTLRAAPAAPGGPRGSMFNWHTIVGFGVGSVGCAQWGGCAAGGGGGDGGGLWAARCCSSRCALAALRSSSGLRRSAAPNRDFPFPSGCCSARIRQH